MLLLALLALLVLTVLIALPVLLVLLSLSTLIFMDQDGFICLGSSCGALCSPLGAPVTILRDLRLSSPEPLD